MSRSPVGRSAAAPRRVRDTAPSRFDTLPAKKLVSGADVTGPGEPATFQDVSLFGGLTLTGGVFVG